MSLEKVDKKNRHKYVESLVTGKFQKVSSSFDPFDIGDNMGMDADGDGIISTMEKMEFEMKEAQKQWFNLLNNCFNLMLGLLAGLSLLEGIFITFIDKKETFIASYTHFANLACFVDVFLVNLSFIFGLALCFIFSHKMQQMNLHKDANRLEWSRLYNFTLLSTFMVFIAWVCLQILPKYSNIIGYLTYDQVTD